MTKIYYIWPHDFRWKNNVLGQRLIMLNPLGLLHILLRKSKRIPMNLDLNIKVCSYGLDSRISEYLSIITYFVSIICVLSFKRICGYIKSCDVVYTNFEYSFLIGIWARQVLGIKWVADFFDDPRRGYLNASLRGAPKARVAAERALLKISRRFLKRADLVICNAPDHGRGLASVLMRDFSVPEGKLLAVPAGVHEQYIRNCLSDPVLNKKVDDILKGRGIKEYQYLYFVGQINSDISGVHGLLKALLLLLEKGFDYHLVLAGFCKPKEGVWLESVIRSNRLVHRVHYLGVVDQPLSYVFMKRSRFCICPYNTEGRDDYKWAYPIKLLEYLTVGVPTVAVRTPITEKIVNDFGFGEMVEDSSGHSIASLIESMDNKRYCRRQGRPPVDYSWKNINNTLRMSIKTKVMGAAA